MEGVARFAARRRSVLAETARSGDNSILNRGRALGKQFWVVTALLGSTYNYMVHDVYVCS